MGTGLERERRELALAAARLDARDPARVVSRGFALVTDADGHVARDPAQIQRGQPLTVRLARGRLEVARTDGPERDD